VHATAGYPPTLSLLEPRLEQQQHQMTMPEGTVNGMMRPMLRGRQPRAFPAARGIPSKRKQRARRRILRTLRRILRAAPGSSSPEKGFQRFAAPKPSRTSEFKVQTRTAEGLPSHSTGRTIRDTSRWRAGRGDQQKRSRHVHEPACAAYFFILHCSHLARSSDPAHAEIHILWILGRGQVV
jgi:hypothetical protein